MTTAPPDDSAPTHALVLTGERTLPGIPDENYWFQRHVVAYELAARAVRERFTDAVALDAGCGEGYGLRMLAEAGASRVIGADLDQSVVDHVRSTYGDDRVEAVPCELMALPLADGEVDLTVSFQVIEHLHDIPGYLASLRRVTRAGGEVWIATPNRLTFTPDSDTPTNPFHTREFAPDELVDELERAHLSVVEVLGIHHGRFLSAFEARAGATFMDLVSGTEPGDWSDDLRATVHAVEPSWFDVRTDDLASSLDLLARCVVA